MPESFKKRTTRAYTAGYVASLEDAIRDAPTDGIRLHLTDLLRKVRADGIPPERPRRERIEIARGVPGITDGGGPIAGSVITAGTPVVMAVDRMVQPAAWAMQLGQVIVNTPDVTPKDFYELAQIAARSRIKGDAY